MNEASADTAGVSHDSDSINPSKLPNPVRTVVVALILLLVAAVVAHRIGRGEFDFNTDETQHATTGLYVSDFLRDLPLAAPVQYTYRWYAHYPALSGVLHWPPLFYVAEGAVFRIFGPSVITARLTILLFALIGIYVWFQSVETWLGTWAAVVSSLLLAFLPFVLFLEEAVMLEIPSLSLCLAATLFWARYLFDEHPRDLYWFAVMAGLALLTKQNAVYLVPLCALSIVLFRKPHLLISRPMLRCYAIVIALAGPFYLISAWVHWSTIALDLEDQQITGLARYWFYPRTLPSELGWPLLVLALAGMPLSLLWGNRRHCLMMLAWIAACYLTFTPIGLKEDRYIVYWIPPFLYFAVAPLFFAWRMRATRVAAGLLAIVLVASSTLSAWRYERPYVSGYREAARRVTQLAPSGVVLVDMPIPANFIFFVRTFDPDRRFVVLRKALYVTRFKASGGIMELVKNQDELLDMFRRYGVRFICIAPEGPVESESQVVLRDGLQSDQFRVVGTFPVETNQSSWEGRRLVLYENMAYGPPTDKELRIPMLSLGRDIVVPFEQLNLR